MKIIIVLILLAIGYGWYMAPSSDIDVPGFEQYKAKNIEPFNFADENGNPINITDYQGSVVLFHLWATNCPPCVRELPSLSKLAKDYKNKNIYIVTVSVGRQRSSEPIKRFFHERVGIRNLPAFIDTFGGSQKISTSRAIPQSYIIDKKGKLVAHTIGSRNWSSPDIRSMLDHYINEQ